jgi:alpha-D-ribose 1-methylphosphonate 5-triphosphate synthase subunit PhnL
MIERLRAIDLEKSFTLHNQGGVRLDVLSGVNLSVDAGECLALNGPSGAGKSTLLRILYANYRPQRGHVLVRHADTVVDLASASPRVVMEVRRRTLGYVSQFLRVVPRVGALDVVAEPLLALGVEPGLARQRAASMLERLHIPERLWPLAPSTFSGGEQQRVNIARGFAVEYPIMLLDEPTASLDAANREAVIDLITEARRRGAALIGIFHDRDVRDALATRIFDLQDHRAAA